MSELIIRADPIGYQLEQEAEKVRMAGDLGYTSRILVQCTLPHGPIAGNEFSRTNGRLTLSVMSPSQIGLPWGSLPRLILAHLISRAVAEKTPELYLGDSMSAFMRELGYTSTGGPNGSINRIKNQMIKLFASTISYHYKDGSKASLEHGMRVSNNSQLWWHSIDPGQGSLWKSRVELTDQFYKEIVSNPVPVNMSALRQLKQSPMALDIYCWMTYRMSYLKTPVVVSWNDLAMQFGADYGDLRGFKVKFSKHLKKVQEVYKYLNVSEVDRGIELRPSLTHIRKKPSVILPI